MVILPHSTDFNLDLLIPKATGTTPACPCPSSSCLWPQLAPSRSPSPLCPPSIGSSNGEPAQLNFPLACQLIAHNQLEDAPLEFIVMVAGVVGAGATLAFMLPGLDSFFSW